MFPILREFSTVGCDEKIFSLYCVEHLGSVIDITYKIYNIRKQTNMSFQYGKKIIKVSNRYEGKIKTFQSLPNVVVVIVDVRIYT